MRSTETSWTSDSESGLDHDRRAHTMRAPVDVSADALRRRADALLDEMMLIGVDVAAGDLPFGSSFAPDAAEPASANGHFENGAYHTDPSAPSYFDQPAPAAPAGDIRDTAQDRAADGGGPALSPAESAAYSQAAAGSRFTPHHEELPSRPANLVPAEARYARPVAPTADVMPDNGQSLSSAVRRQSSSLASTMTVGARSTLRASLLPRQVEVDVSTAEQEIHALLGEISATLPVGHEAAERGRHLLGKAQNILKSDPTRTAEVDYYLQQVRRIVQRTRQTHTYSSLYRRRLMIYLWGWLGLAATVLAARFLLQAELLALLQDFFWTGDDALVVEYGPLVIGAAFAGALGAALNMLLAMRRQTAQEYAYFDRKFGLRGLLLPILGAVFGLLVGVAWAAVCYFAGLDGANLWIGAAPAFVAFLIGFGQEWLYGVR